MKAFAVAGEKGNLAELVAQDSCTALCHSEDITSIFVATRKKASCALRPCALAVQKAAIISFQTWALQKPGTVAVVLGRYEKQKFACPSFICSDDIGPSLLQDPKVLEACLAHNMEVCGIALVGKVEVPDDRAMAVNFAAKLPKTTAPATICIFVPCQQARHFFWVNTISIPYLRVLSLWPRQTRELVH